MFGQRIVLLSGADVIRNALQDEAFAGRPNIGIAEEITKGWGARLFYFTRTCLFCSIPVFRSQIMI